MSDIHLTPQEQELYDALGNQNELVVKLQDIIGYVALHINERWVVSKLTTEEKEIWADAVEAFGLRLHADDPAVEAGPYERWWRE